MSESIDRLVLDDATSFTGVSFGAARTVRGEVVFNTGMTGYVEALTDPSYRGQILVLTYPLQGNYGVPRGPYESDGIQVAGLVVTHYSGRPSHHRSVRTLDRWLKSEGVPALHSVDTRALTRRLRERGTMLGAIERGRANEIDLSAWTDPAKVLDEVVSQEVVTYPGGSLRILLIDTGAKENIVRSLVGRGATVVRSPWNQDWERLLPEVDGIMLSNGPGDPADATSFATRLRAILGIDKPIFGICLGHQVLALAAGAQCAKLLYGHRSANQPVRDLRTGHCYITSQNHGYVVDAHSLDDNWAEWFINLNDGTNEGFRHRSRPIRSVQFHPEAFPGPTDTAFLFDEFLTLVAAAKRGDTSAAA
jgi:carbamoyl-phosphate synthase small subunit